MKLPALGDVFKDRKGDLWRIIDTEGQRLAPLTASRWMGKDFQTRTFQRNGSYWPNREDKWDLVEFITNIKE